MEDFFNKKIQFFEVSNEYISYLKQFEKKIPNFKYDTREKFVCGIVLNMNGQNYYAPVSSFNKEQKTNFVLKIGEYPIGSVRFSFMFPVPDSEIKEKDFGGEKNDYKNLVKKELQICNNNYSKITTKAEKVYQTKIKGEDPIINLNCCDFKLLETKCKAWQREVEKNVFKSTLSQRKQTAIEKFANINDTKSINNKEKVR